MDKPLPIASLTIWNKPDTNIFELSIDSSTDIQVYTKVEDSNLYVDALKQIADWFAKDPQIVKHYAMLFRRNHNGERN